MQKNLLDFLAPIKIFFVDNNPKKVYNIIVFKLDCAKEEKVSLRAERIFYYG